MRDEGIFHLWPENVEPWRLWGEVQTQWRRAGLDRAPVGLDYAGVLAWLQGRGIRGRRLRRRMQELQVMERAALEEWAQQRR
ncbi:DUF1799 domain-containing protein [Caldimonas tepidiphila]|uniref:DUF1799 domain-containing protein n=1 Tax=Caldimonas tepidiphila TaxID=2315841 RepID=UPI0013004D35|nr:DUF1799 domain-containing protein [Caldimonas tepidiphila]